MGSSIYEWLDGIYCIKEVIISPDIDFTFALNNNRFSQFSLNSRVLYFVGLACGRWVIVSISKDENEIFMIVGNIQLSCRLPFGEWNDSYKTSPIA